MLRVLLKLLETGREPKTLAVGCYDLGQFITHYPAGKGIVTGAHNPLLRRCSAPVALSLQLPMRFGANPSRGVSGCVRQRQVCAICCMAHGPDPKQTLHTVNMRTARTP